ncbi:MAG: hypothetical protein HC906_05630 [Bacteroidales bacterium]|nr:hypothetical protein [Bacteroidales bacterium]
MILKNECIILPGFGGFETHYQPASLDKVSGKILPPSKQVVFREEYKVDNGTLLNYVCEKEKISEDEAQQFIEKYVSELKFKLELQSRVDIPEIGILIKPINGKVFLKPIDHENYLIDSFGLSELKLPFQREAEKNVVIPGPEKKSHSIKGAALLIPLLTVFVTFLIILSVRVGLLKIF